MADDTGKPTPGVAAAKAVDELSNSSRMNPEATKSLEPAPGGLYLDPSDPFEKACIEMVLINRKKRADYALDGDPFSNFHMTSAALGLDGFGPIEAVSFNIAQKEARLRSLAKNGRMGATQNEGVTDTYLDHAVYSVIRYAMYNSFNS
jgi:hypothetical protein